MNPLDRNRPMYFEKSCCTDCRSPVHYADVLQQFDLAAPRYQPDPVTQCSTYVWDCTRALGCEIPRLYGANGGVGKALSGNADFCWLQANDMFDWLSSLDGQENGWKEVTEDQASRNASSGLPTVVVYKNEAGGHGHIAMVIPSQPIQGVLIAQAGAINAWGIPVDKGFGALPRMYFSHA